MRRRAQVGRLARGAGAPADRPRVARDPVVTAVARRMRSADRCHTAILYGSRARGDHGPASDYDFLGIRARGPERARAERRRGRYVDVLLVPEGKARRTDPALLPVKDGVVLFERAGAGRRLLARLRRLDAKGPPRPDPAEVRRRTLWASKMLGRVRRGGAVGDFRRFVLVVTLLEDWHYYRRRWFHGAKPAFATLAAEDPATHRLFVRAIRAPGDAVLAALVRRVTGRRPG